MDVNIVIFIMLHVKLVCTEWKYNLNREHWNFVLIIVKDFKPIPAEWCLVLCFCLRIDFFTEMFYVATDVSTFCHFTFGSFICVHVPRVYM